MENHVLSIKLSKKEGNVQVLGILPCSRNCSRCCINPLNPTPGGLQAELGTAGLPPKLKINGFALLGFEFAWDPSPLSSFWPLPFVIEIFFLCHPTIILQKHRTCLVSRCTAAENFASVYDHTSSLFDTWFRCHWGGTLDLRLMLEWVKTFEFVGNGWV